MNHKICSAEITQGGFHKFTQKSETNRYYIFSPELLEACSYEDNKVKLNVGGYYMN